MNALANVGEMRHDGNYNACPDVGTKLDLHLRSVLPFYLGCIGNEGLAQLCPRKKVNIQQVHHNATQRRTYQSAYEVLWKEW